jgi:hypothetical protein
MLKYRYMSPTSFLDLATLPERDGFTETVTDFGLRILTSRLPNELRLYKEAVLKNALLGQVRILAIGEPEGAVLTIKFSNEDAGLEVGVHTNSFKLEGPGLDGGYSGCAGREWVSKYPDRQPEILAHTTRLLGELGLYSGIAI